jgi:hypothetical protein
LIGAPFNDTIDHEEWSGCNAEEGYMAVLTRHWEVAILWALSLVAISAISSLAQAQRDRPNLITEQPTIVSGADVGFRIERTQNGIAVGKVVVHVDGRWVDTAPAR